MDNNNLAKTRVEREGYRDWYSKDRLLGMWYKTPRDYAKMTFQSKLLVAYFGQFKGVYLRFNPQQRSFGGLHVHG